MTKIKLDSGIPVPEPTYQSYNFDDMLVGQSFFMPGKAGVRARMAGYNWARRNKAKMKSVKVKEGGKNGIRIWRTA